MSHLFLFNRYAKKALAEQVQKVEQAGAGEGELDATSNPAELENAVIEDCSTAADQNDMAAVGGAQSVTKEQPM